MHKDLQYKTEDQKEERLVCLSQQPGVLGKEVLYYSY